MKKSFTDIHHHLAFGMDDGPSGRRKMYKMIDAAAGQGIRKIIATPHATPGVERFDFKKYRAALDDARAYIERNQLGITLYEGCEVLYTPQACRMLEDGKIPTLADTDFVLVEFSPDIAYGKLYRAIENLACSGYRPVIAHVERYRCLAVWPGRAIRLKDEFDVFYQVNCASVIKYKDFFTRRFLKKMLKLRLIDAVATDAHNTSSRPVNMDKAWRALKKIVGSSYARRLTNGSMIVEYLDENE